ncbi:hypothetical protein CXF83_21490 [Shewanella sp. Choline-02u-19]|uniref:hypothetical protein n=1 Tax=Shewanella sp. Choline-02u-19 TaxID=2058309 RepID=UPI000C34D760|nr:hypothetical protein [Shewanella sp. Choline-02u-19]PKI29100.1 hypothetical protein CXF83_21490 [Shewanella sp. Choline-02u-19]
MITGIGLQQTVIAGDDGYTVLEDGVAELSNDVAPDGSLSNRSMAPGLAQNIAVANGTVVIADGSI